jgi:SAM-dependent methyltransferase
MDEDAAGDTYIHGTAPSEQQRLAALNRLTNGVFRQFLGIEKGMRALEVGSGLGLLACEVASVADDVQVVGVEKSPEQIAAAARLPNVRYVQGDAHHLDFTDDTFDLVYARYLLEHVSDPEQVVMEMRRVVRPMGRVAVCENDISLLRLDPPCPTFEKTWVAFQQYQKSLGGDALIGRRLYRLFRGAGLSRIELSVQPELHWHGSPEFPGWISNLVGNLESARHGLVESGFCDDGQIGQATSELFWLAKQEDASALFVWNRALATK